MMKKSKFSTICAILLLLCLVNQLPAQNKIFLASAHPTWAETIEQQSGLYFNSLKSRTQLWSQFATSKDLKDYENKLREANVLELNSPRWAKIRRPDAIWYFPEFILTRERLHQIAVRRVDALVTLSWELLDAEPDSNHVQSDAKSISPVTLYVDIPINQGFRASWDAQEREPWNRKTMAALLDQQTVKEVKPLSPYSRALESSLGEVFVLTRSGYSDGLSRKVVVPVDSFEVLGFRNRVPFIDKFQPTSLLKAGDKLVLTRFDDLSIFELPAADHSVSKSKLAKEKKEGNRLFHCLLGRNE